MMNNRFLRGGIFAIALFLVLDLSGQIAIGASGGMNLAWQQNSFLNTGFSDIGPFTRFGTHAEYKFRGRFSLGFEVAYAGQGYQMSVEYTDVNDALQNKSKFQQRYNYIDAGFLAKYRISERKTRPYFLLASSMGYLLSGHTKIFNVKIDGHQGQNIKDDIAITDYSRQVFSMSGGLGLEVSVGGKGHIFGELRYQHGFNDIFEPTSTDVRNRSLALTAGYAFVFPKREN